VNRWLRAVAFLLGLVVLALLVTESGPAVILERLVTSGWVVGPLVLLWGFTYACNARAWQLLVPERPPEFTFGRAFLITVAAFAMNFATPLLALGGEPIKINAATPSLGSQRAVGSVVSFRFLHAIAHVVVFLLAVIPAVMLLPHTPLVLTILALGAAILLLLAVFLLSQHRLGVFERGLGLIGRIPLLRRLAPRLERHRPMLRAMDVELTAVHRAGPGHFTGALLTELAGRMVCTLEYFVILWGLGLGHDLPRAFLIANLSSIITNLLFFIPFEMGAKEGGAYAIFGWLGLDPTFGTAAALLSRVRELVWLAIGVGCLLLLGDPERPARRAT
jgi:hypothetical protein